MSTVSRSAWSPLARMCACAWVAALVVVSTPSEASACACCDGGDSATVLGFTDGDAVLVERHGARGCQAYDQLEVWRPSAPSPVRCFDLNSSTPNRPLACDDVEPSDAFADPSGSDHPRRRFFPNAPRFLPASHVRASLRRYAPPAPPAGAVDDEDDGEDEDELDRPTHTLVVEVRTSEGVQPVLSLDVLVHSREMDGQVWQDESAPDGRYEEYEADDAPSWTLPPPNVEVRVAVGPTGNHLVVLVHGHDTMPGIGHFPTSVHPSAIRGLDPSVLVGEAPAPVLAIPVWEAPEADADASTLRATVDRFNRYALTLHQAGRYAEAAAWWTRLLAMAPDDANLRYNLACAQARLGNPERALELLSELQQRSRGNACRACSERMRRARRDPDLATVRALPGYAAMLRGR